MPMWASIQESSAWSAQAMVVQLAGPGVECGQDAHLCADEAFLGGQVAHRLGGGLHQQTVEDFLVA